MDNEPLGRFAGFIAEEGVRRARRQAQLFEQELATCAFSCDGTQRRDLMIAFAFLNWSIANGVWSNLNNTRLRRDLMEATVQKFSTELAKTVTAGSDVRDVALEAVRIDEQLRQMLRGWVGTLGELDRFGANDARASLFFAMDRIQACLGISDPVMDLLVPRFLAHEDFAAEMEHLASQLNRAADDRSKKGTLSRFLEGFRKD
ncbi:MAG TPA: hypothetical protein VNK82_11660 [Terriglobales bacterium]|nr:hypothetical protein [Terriglobales bacterium]